MILVLTWKCFIEKAGFSRPYRNVMCRAYICNEEAEIKFFSSQVIIS